MSEAIAKTSVSAENKITGIEAEDLISIEDLEIYKKVENRLYYVKNFIYKSLHHPYDYGCELYFNTELDYLAVEFDRQDDDFNACFADGCGKLNTELYDYVKMPLSAVFMSDEELLKTIKEAFSVQIAEHEEKLESLRIRKQQEAERQAQLEKEKQDKERAEYERLKAIYG